MGSDDAGRLVERSCGHVESLDLRDPSTDQEAGQRPCFRYWKEEYDREESSDCWILTSAGRQVHLLDLASIDVEIEEVAHALANLCRFGGHCREFYSVAQHSILVALNLPEHLRLQGLLYDAAEAYVGDVVRPLKRRLPDYVEIEDGVWGAIAAKFGLPLELDPAVRAVDTRVLLTEKRDLLPPHPYAWTEEQVDDRNALPYDHFQVVPLPPKHARRRFVELYREVTSAAACSRSHNYPEDADDHG